MQSAAAVRSVPAAPRVTIDRWPFGLTARDAIAIVLAAIVGAFAFLLPGELAGDQRAALAITGLAIIGWTVSRLPDATVAILAAVAMVASGALSGEALESSLGHPMIWLMLSAFVMGGVLVSSGAAERVALSVTRPFKTVRALFYGVAAVIAATAFVIPSTSGRAALLMPVFMVLVSRLPDARLTRAFALLFPTVILLSAGGSLMGAGAHVIAADALTQATGRTIGMLEWSALTLPFTLVACLASVELILQLFACRHTRRLTLTENGPAPAPIDRRQVIVGLIVLGTVALWATVPLHGLPAPVVALLGATAALSKPLSDVSPKQAFRKVDVELLVFLAATLSLARGLSATGVDLWLAGKLLAAAPAVVTENQALVVILAAGVAVSFHLVVNSRTARAAVLFPALVIPLAGLGHDAALLALVVILGTGVCQTLPASAKPVAVFASIEGRGFSAPDLLKLSLALGPLVLGLLALFGIVIWPEQLATFRAPA